MESLPEGILEEILLRLPYIAIVRAKEVCRKWKQALESKGFRESYTDTVKLVEKSCHADHQEHKLTFEVVDSTNEVLRWDWEKDMFLSGMIASHINGLVMKSNYEEDKYYIGNVFTNKWEQIPAPPSGWDTFERTVIFYLGGGQYKLVYWIAEQVMILNSAQLKWFPAARHRIGCSTDPVVIRDSVFSVNGFEGILMEYNATLDSFSSVQIRGTQEEPLYFCTDAKKVELVVWQGGLYLLILNIDRRKSQKVEIWRVSTGDGRASLLSKFKMEQRVDNLKIKEVEDNGLVHLQGFFSKDTDTVAIVIYNMVANCVQDISYINSRTTFKIRTVPVRLAGAPNTFL